MGNVQAVRRADSNNTLLKWDITALSTTQVTIRVTNLSGGSTVLTVDLSAFGNWH